VPYGQSGSFPVSAPTPSPATPSLLAASGLPAGLHLGPTTFNQATSQWTATVSGTDSAAAGTYTASITANDGTSASTPQSVSITVTRAPLTITANNKQLIYGNPVPAFDAGYSGFVNSDSTSVVGGLVCGATDASGHP